MVFTPRPEGTESVRSFDVSPNFSIRAVDGLRDGPPVYGGGQAQKPLGRAPAQPVPELKSSVIFNHPDDDPRLGPVLGKFVGTFRYLYLLQLLLNLF